MRLFQAQIVKVVKNMRNFSKWAGIALLAVAFGACSKDDGPTDNPNDPGMLIFGDSATEAVFSDYKDSLSVSEFVDDVGISTAVDSVFTAVQESDSFSTLEKTKETWQTHFKTNLAVRSNSYAQKLADRMDLAARFHSRVSAQVADLDTQLNQALEDETRFENSNRALVSYFGNDICDQGDNSFDDADTDGEAYAERMRGPLEDLVENMKTVHGEDFKIYVTQTVDVSFLLGSGVQDTEKTFFGVSKSCGSWFQKETQIMDINQEIPLINKTITIDKTAQVTPFWGYCPNLFPGGGAENGTDNQGSGGTLEDATARQAYHAALADAYVANLNLLIDEVNEANGWADDPRVIPVADWDASSLTEESLAVDCFHPNADAHQTIYEHIYDDLNGQGQL